MAIQYSKIADITIPDVQPLPFQRTGGNMKRRFLPEAMRNYYREIYPKMLEGLGRGRLLIKPDSLLALQVWFFRKTKVIADLDNLIKAFLDAGQYTKWAKKNDMPSPDLWNDKQFKVFSESFVISDCPRPLIWARIYLVKESSLNGLKKLISSLADSS